MLRRLSWTALLLALAGGSAFWWWPVPDPPLLASDWRAAVSIIGAPGRFTEPFGITVDPRGMVYVADGAGAHRISAIAPDGRVSIVAGGGEGFSDGIGETARFDTPSGLATCPDGSLYVADTGNNAVRRISPDGHVSTISSDFNGPIGIACDSTGRVMVADTYNDRLALIDVTGIVSTLPLTVTLDTPTDVAVDASGTLYIADAGNDVVRSVSPDGSVTTIDAGAVGGLRRPLGIEVDTAGTLYIADESSRVIEVQPQHRGGMVRVLAGNVAGFHNGLGEEAQFRRPAGIVSREPGRLIVADSGNALVRSVTATTLAEASVPPPPFAGPRFDVRAFTAKPLLWPLEPLSGPFEIAGTLGEARGGDAGRFHAGIDVRAEQGAPVLAVRDGVITSPLATGDFGTLNEWLRIGELTYVHLRAGRTHRGEVVDPQFVATRDERGTITRMRVKRGARFSTGDVVGTVNQFNHVHLNVGWGGEEYNPLLFRLVQFADTIPPTIARGGVRLFDSQWSPFAKRTRGRLLISGPVQIVVDAWDQADGNRPNRRLGVYALGYQILKGDGTPAPGYAEPVETIRFDRLASNPDATRLVYAPGSGIPFYGQRRTRFLYIVTNTLRDGVAAPGVWDTTTLPPGDYTVRVKVADINGNEAVQHRDLPVTIAGRESTGGR